MPEPVALLLGEPVLLLVPLGGVVLPLRLLPELVLCAIADALDRASAATPAIRRSLVMMCSRYCARGWRA
jgi:hypothetical protein